MYERRVLFREIVLVLYRKKNLRDYREDSFYSSFEKMKI